MHSASPHECLIYEGAPAPQFPGLASIIDRKLKENYCCLYLGSPAVVSEFHSFLSGAGFDVEREASEGNLLLSSSRNHLVDGWQFDVEAMMHMLEKTLAEALSDGYQGLWATGDMTWELGPSKDFSKLVDYEMRLDNFLRQNQNIGGICQYCADTLPPEVVRQGLRVHPRLLARELSFENGWYSPQSFPPSAALDSELDAAIDRILRGPSTDAGEILLQLPDDVKYRAEELAKGDGVSLEDFILFAVAERIERFAPPTPNFRKPDPK